MAGEGSDRLDQNRTEEPNQTEHQGSVDPHNQALPHDQVAAGGQQEGSGTEFEMVPVTGPVTEPDRDPPGGQVSPTGLTRSNTGGFLLTEKLVRDLGIDPETYALAYGVSVAKRQIALYPVDGKTAGAAPVRRNADRQRLTFYLKPIFQKYPELRVTRRQQCNMFRDIDAKGRQCIVLALGVALDKPKATGGKSETENE